MFIFAVNVEFICFVIIIVVKIGLSFLDKVRVNIFLIILVVLKVISFLVIWIVNIILIKLVVSKIISKDFGLMIVICLMVLWW